MFVTTISVSNQQSYSFLSFADSVLMWLPMLVIFAITAYFPISTRPEAYFIRLLRSYFRSAEYLMSIMNWGITHNPSRFDRWRKAYQVHQLNTLPEKLNGWSDRIDTKALSDTSPEQIAALVNSQDAENFYRLLGAYLRWHVFMGDRR